MMISVIIPLYNKRDTIIKTIDSVLKQTYPNFELIIVNDGSYDGSVDLINASFYDKRIVIINQNNSGVSIARNNGVKASKGKWITFLDADDEWLPTYLEEIASAIHCNHQAEMIGCGSYILNYETNQIGTNRMIDSLYNKVENIDFFTNPDIMSHIGATCIRKDIFIKNGGFDTHLKNNEDILLIGNIALNHKYYYIGKLLHVYKINIPGQVTRDCAQINSRFIDSLTVINKFMEQYINDKNNQVLIAMKFRYRDYLLRLLRIDNYELVNYYIENINATLKKNMFPLEWINNRKIKKIAIVYILLTKIIWRFHGFQPRNHKSKYQNQLLNIYNSMYKK